MKRALVAIAILVLLLPFTDWWQSREPTELEEHAQQRGEQRLEEEEGTLTSTGTVTGIPGPDEVIVQLESDFYGRFTLPGLYIPTCAEQPARQALREYALGKVVTIEEGGYVRLENQDLGSWLIWNSYARAHPTINHVRSNEYEALERRSETKISCE